MNKIDLNGRCAVVTGGAQGFGRAITERFVSSGARVAIWDHDQPFAEKTAKEIGSGVTAIKVDVSDLAAVEKARDATLKAMGYTDLHLSGIVVILATIMTTISYVPAVLLSTGIYWIVRRATLLPIDHR